MTTFSLLFLLKQFKLVKYEKQEINIKRQYLYLNQLGMWFLTIQKENFQFTDNKNYFLRSVDENLLNLPKPKQYFKENIDIFWFSNMEHFPK